MKATSLLPIEALYHRCDPTQFAFATTHDLDELKEMIGQERAVEAVLFGIGIRRDGYNMFALGPSGTGKHTLVHGFIAQQASAEPTPNDWCYINNFAESTKPVRLELPPGKGTILKRDIAQLIDELRTAIPAAFETESFRTRRQAIDEEIEERHEAAFRALGEEAQKQGVARCSTRRPVSSWLQYETRRSSPRSSSRSCRARSSRRSPTSSPSCRRNCRPSSGRVRNGDGKGTRSSRRSTRR